MLDIFFTPAGIAGAIGGGLAALVAVIFLGLKRGNKPCPTCGENLPAFRLLRNFRQFMWGGWTCTRCGHEVDRFREEVKP